MCHHTKFRQNRSNGCREIALNVFQDGGRPPFWICGANFGTTLNENLMVFITVQNLVAVGRVVRSVVPRSFVLLGWR